MDLNTFQNSTWVKSAQQIGSREKVIQEFPTWLGKVANTDLRRMARELWVHFTSGRASTADFVLIIAALLYLISPIDLVPDFIPVIGWLDDIGVASLVLTYLSKKIQA
jgi:uncharacterized membrane protein YkvA (DUF1232 family)